MITREEYCRPIEPPCADAYTRWFLNLTQALPSFHLTPGGRMRWRGFPAWKTPSDFWTYQEIIHDVRPELIVEFGTHQGGTSLFLADMQRLAGIPNARVLTVDVGVYMPRPEDERIQYVTADSNSPEAYTAVQAEVGKTAGPILVIEDSKHEYMHVLQELGLYCGFVTPGSYFIVEDTYTALCAESDWPRSVARAVLEFLNGHPEFVVDWGRESFGTTTNHGGYLRRLNNEPSREGDTLLICES